MNIQNTSVLITGGSRGIGRATAIMAAKKGANVAINFIKHEQEAKEVEKEVTKMGVRVLLVKGDVSDEKDAQQVVRSVAYEFGSVDVLINNAGIISWKPMEEEKLTRLHRVLDVNVKGMVNMTYEAVKYMKEQERGGVIVNIASGAGKTAYPNLAVYSASKFAVLGFTQAVAKEVEAEKVRVYSVSPGMTATEMTGGSGMEPDEVAKKILAVASEQMKLVPGDDVEVF